MASPARGTLPSLASLADVGALPSQPEIARREASADRIGTGVNSPAAAASNRTSRELEAEQDRALIELAQKGDKLAFKQLVQRHQRRAFGIALGLLRDEHDARDVVQEAFLRVHRGLDSFQGGSSFFTWLYRIVTNLSIDLMRKPARRDAELDDGREIDEADIPLLSRIDGADPLDAIRRELAVVTLDEGAR